MINWKVRFKNPLFWISLVSELLVLITLMASLFGYKLDLNGINDQAVEIIKTVFLILGTLGIVADPTTKGVGDSERAMTYDEPN